mgnify:CR=1 FL=1
MIHRISLAADDSNVALVELEREKIVKVDACEIDRITKFSWIARNSKGKFYACALDRPKRKGGRYVILMHRLLLGLDIASRDSRFIDHINGDSLDNRRSNLRVATEQQNHWNYPKTHLGHPLFKGVRRHGNRWKAYICLDNKYRHIGSFVTDIEAAKAYDKAAIELFGEFAKPNFER